MLQYKAYPVTHLVVACIGKDVHLLLRNEVSQYFKLATLYCSVTWTDIEVVAKALTWDFSVEIVDLGLLENREFISQDVGKPFVDEISSIVGAILNFDEKLFVKKMVEVDSYNNRDNWIPIPKPPLGKIRKLD